MKRDMRKAANKQHLGTAANRNAYEQHKSIIIKNNREKPEKDQQEKTNKED